MHLDHKFKRLFLHVGLGKTGTTTIQKDLLANAELLESRYGLHYPRGFSHAKRHEGNHSILLRALFSDTPEVQGRLVAMGLATPQTVDKFNDKTLAQLKRGFESTTASDLLISAEGVGHFRRPQMDDLAAWLSEISESIIVVACVRHPLQALSSEIQQRLCIGEVLETMYENPPGYLFRHLFKRLEGAFGRENVMAYSFADAVREECGVTAMLLRQLGIAAEADFPKSSARNLSMSHEGALLLSACNRQRPILVDGARNPERLGVNFNYFRNLPGRPYRAPAEVYSAVAVAAVKDVQWVEREYSINLGSFDEHAEEDYRAFSQESIEFIADVLADRSRSKYPLLGSIIRVLAKPYLRLRKMLR